MIDDLRSGRQKSEHIELTEQPGKIFAPSRLSTSFEKPKVDHVEVALVESVAYDEVEEINKVRNTSRPAEDPLSDVLHPWHSFVQITPRAWTYAAIGALWYMTTTFHLASTSVFRQSMAESLGNAPQGIWVRHVSI